MACAVSVMACAVSVMACAVSVMACAVSPLEAGPCRYRIPSRPWARMSEAPPCMRWRGLTRPGCTTRRLLGEPALPDRSPEAKTKPRAPVSRPFRPSEVAFEISLRPAAIPYVYWPRTACTRGNSRHFHDSFAGTGLVHRTRTVIPRSDGCPPPHPHRCPQPVDTADLRCVAEPQADRTGPRAAQWGRTALRSPDSPTPPDSRRPSTVQRSGQSKAPRPTMFRQVEGLETRFPACGGSLERIPPPPQVGVSVDTSTPAGRRIFRVRVFHPRWAVDRDQGPGRAAMVPSIRAINPHGQHDSGVPPQRSTMPLTNAACPACCRSSEMTLTSRTPRDTGGFQAVSTIRSRSESVRVRTNSIVCACTAS
jgi:hypothetical protein